MHRTTVWAIYVSNIWTLPFFWTLNMNSFFLKLNTFIQWNKWIHSYLSDKLLCLNMNSDINFIILISAFQLLTKIFLFRLFWVEWNGRFIVCVFYIILWKNIHLLNTKSTIFQHWSLFCMSQAFWPNWPNKIVKPGFSEPWIVQNTQFLPQNGHFWPTKTNLKLVWGFSNRTWAVGT